ncbi:unnamed protein product, partial [Didymodactylos carnosus]
LVKCLEELKDDSDKDTRETAKSLLKKLTSYEFYVLLSILHQLLATTAELQKEELNLAEKEIASFGTDIECEFDRLHRTRLRSCRTAANNTSAYAFTRFEKGRSLDATVTGNVNINSYIRARRGQRK